MPEVEMLTIEQTAKRSQMPENAIRTLVKEERIVFTKIGKKSLINWNKFIEFLNTGEKSKEEIKKEHTSYGKIRKVH